MFYDGYMPHKLTIPDDLHDLLEIVAEHKGFSLRRFAIDHLYAACRAGMGNEHLLEFQARRVMDRFITDAGGFTGQPSDHLLARNAQFAAATALNMPFALVPDPTLPPKELPA